MSKTDYEEAELLKNETGQTNALGTARTPYIALFTVAPGEATAGTEVATGAYARVNASGKFAAPSGGSIASNAAVTFPVATAAYTVVGVGLMDAASSGNLLRYQAITSKTISIGDQANFPSGSITFTED